MNWFKKISQLTEENTQNIDSPLIMVEPYEPIIQEVVNEITNQNSSFFQGVNKINVDMGYGQYGSVSSENPADININFNKIKNEVVAQLGSPFDPNSPQHVQALKDSIKEVIIHEKSHVQDYDYEGHIEGKDPFPGGESVADMAVQTYLGN